MDNNVLDNAVLARQSIGPLKGNSKDKKLADEVMAGRILLKPHASWSCRYPLRWSEDPFKDPNWCFQLHTLRWVDPVRRRAAAGDRAARDFWINLVRSWIEANPPDRPASAFSWADMADGLRAMGLAVGVPLATPEELEWLLPSLEQHGDWLADPSHVGRANHALHQHQGLFVLGRAMRRPDWVRLAVDRMGALLAEEYDEQGVNAEGAIAYHRNNLIWWDATLQRLDLEGVPRPPAARRIELAAEVLAHSTRPDGLLEMIGDTSSTVPNKVPSPHLDYVVSRGVKGARPVRLAVAVDRGYAFGRTGWGDTGRAFEEETFYSLSYGAADRVHGHADGTAVTFFAGGRPWLVDSGKLSYSRTDPVRAFMRSREAHNVVVVRGRDYRRMGHRVMLEHCRQDELLDDYLLIDRGYTGVELRRRVLFSRRGEFLLVIDDVAAEEDVEVEQLWHLPPDVGTGLGEGVAELRADETSTQLHWCGPAPRLEVLRGVESPVQGWVSTEWQQKEPADVVVAHAEGRALRLVTLVAAPGPDPLRVQETVVDAERVELDLRTGSSRYQVNITPDDARVD